MVKQKRSYLVASCRVASSRVVACRVASYPSLEYSPTRDELQEQNTEKRPIAEGFPSCGEKIVEIAIDTSQTLWIIREN